jgi:hypothetical protein
VFDARQPFFNRIHLRAQEVLFSLCLMAFSSGCLFRLVTLTPHRIQIGLAESVQMEHGQSGKRQTHHRFQWRDDRDGSEVCPGCCTSLVPHPTDA